MSLILYDTRVLRSIGRQKIKLYKICILLEIDHRFVQLNRRLFNGIFLMPLMRGYFPLPNLSCAKNEFLKNLTILVYSLYFLIINHDKNMKRILFFRSKFFDYRSDQQPPNPSDLIPNYNPISIKIHCDQKIHTLPSCYMA